MKCVITSTSRDTDTMETCRIIPFDDTVLGRLFNRGWIKASVVFTFHFSRYIYIFFYWSSCIGGSSSSCYYDIYTYIYICFYWSPCIGASSSLCHYAGINADSCVTAPHPPDTRAKSTDLIRVLTCSLHILSVWSSGYKTWYMLYDGRELFYITYHNEYISVTRWAVLQ